MDHNRTGALIRSLRLERGMTQRGLAERMNISDKTVSKWERGLGCPDVSLLPELSRILGVGLEHLLSGALEENDLVGGNMKKLRCYVCPGCGNLITASGEAGVTCCGKKLLPLEAKKAEEGDRLSVERLENDYFISSRHPMTKDHYVSFVALLTGDSVMVRKLYPEWDLQTRIPAFGHGILLWYCTVHGLYKQLI